MLSFAGLEPEPYIGTLYTQAAFNDANKFGAQPPLPPSTVVTQFLWGNYGVGTDNPNVIVSIIIPNKGPNGLLDKIRSVRIDNLGNPVPVYVYFPDTNFTIAAPPNTVIWEDVATNQFTAFVIGEGFTDNQIGNTAVYFCNFKQNPFINYAFPQSTPLWKASATITRGATIYNQNFGIPALGDQTAQYQVSQGANPGVLASNLFGSPYSSGFIYLTHIDVTVIAGLASGAVSTDIGVSWLIESTGIAGTLYSLNWSSFANVANDLRIFPPATILRLSAMNIKLDATQLWRIRSIVSTNVVELQISHIVNFTINPT